MLSDLQRRHYQEHGYLIVHGFFSGYQIAKVALDADRLLRREELIHTDNLRCRWQDRVETKACLSRPLIR